jgi:Trk K+ transport system NAD-binding subunit
VEPSNLEPFAPMGLGPLIPTMGLIYISYVGFDLITVAAEEIIDPARTIPRAVMITLGVGVAIYVLVLWVMMGVVNYEELAQTSIPFVYVADHLFGAWGRWAGIIATVMASLSAFSVTLGASSRVLYALGRDGHFPGALARLHPTYKTPHLALYICAGLVMVLSGLGVVRFLASVSSFGFLIAIGIVNYSVIALHRRMPNLIRPFKVMFYPIAPIIGMIACWFFIPTLEARSLMLGSGLTAAGVVVYLLEPANRNELRGIPVLLARLGVRIRAYWRPRLRVLIIGGGSEGSNIADRLLKQDEFRMVFRSSEYQLTFIEQDEARAEELGRRFHVPVLHGDGTKPEVLQQAVPKELDVAIAATHNDERNAIVALQAKRLGVPRVIAIARSPDQVSLLEQSGIVCISAPFATAVMVENHLDRPGVAELVQLERGVANLVDVSVPPGGDVVGQRIQDIEIHDECVVAAVIRDEQFVVPRGRTEIKDGDHVVLVGPPAAVKDAHAVFAAIGRPDRRSLASERSRDKA